MTPIAPHISTFLRERLPHQRGASPHTCDSYAYSFQLLLTFASQRWGVLPSQLALEQLDAPLVMDFLAALETETLAFNGPVVMVHGDSHIFRIDQPLVNSTTGRVIENFTRLETFGTPDVHWVRVIVDLNDPNVFTFKPEIVKKNLVDHSIK